MHPNWIAPFPFTAKNNNFKYVSHLYQSNNLSMYGEFCSCINHSTRPQYSVLCTLQWWLLWKHLLVTYFQYISHLYQFNNDSMHVRWILLLYKIVLVLNICIVHYKWLLRKHLCVPSLGLSASSRHKTISKLFIQRSHLPLPHGSSRLWLS